MLNKDQNEKNTVRQLSAEEIADALVKRYGAVANEEQDADDYEQNEIERDSRRKQKIQEMKRRKKQQEMKIENGQKRM